MEATLSIGEVARRSRLNVSAIRFYERKGLLPEPERVGGRRRYEPDAVSRLGTIETAKEVGFSLDDIKALLDSIDRGDPAHEQLRMLAARKLPEIEALISRAEAMRDWLTVAGECACVSLDRCPLFDETPQPA
jgi:MerR family transcriptional regulator, redox-sensitive transcriptional activator SoxR